MKIAIVWASKDRSKYGNKILRDLVNKWHEVIAVNPKEIEIEGIRCINDIVSLPGDVEVINIVTPPWITIKVLEELDKIWLKNVWCQPGATDKTTIEFLKEKWFKYIANACIMLSPTPK